MKGLNNFLLFLTVFIIVLTAIQKPACAESIKVGVILPLTGKLAKFGELENKSFIMAVDEINAAGGINGKKIELIIEDTTGKPDVGRSAIEKLISRDKVILIGGGYGYDFNINKPVTSITIAVKF